MARARPLPWFEKNGKNWTENAERRIVSHLFLPLIKQEKLLNEENFLAFSCSGNFCSKRKNFSSAGKLLQRVD